MWGTVKYCPIPVLMLNWCIKGRVVLLGLDSVSYKLKIGISRSISDTSDAVTLVMKLVFSSPLVIGAIKLVLMLTALPNFPVDPVKYCIISFN